MKSRDTPILRKVKRIDSIPISETFIDDDGFFHDTPIVTSTGIFEYALPDGGVRRELRLPEYVFEKKSLESYVGRPIIITHNAGEVTKDNVKDEIVGTILSEGFRDGNDVRCKVIIHDMNSVKKIPYRELSLGYNLDLIEESGVWEGQKYDAIQTNIRINHLAIVDSARAGEQAHLNLDGKSENDDTKNLKGGRRKMSNTMTNAEKPLSPEELAMAVSEYRKRHSVNSDGTDEPELAKENVEETDAADGSEEPIDVSEEQKQEEGKSPNDIAQAVKDRRDRRDAEDDPADTESAMGVIAQQDEDIDMLLAALEKLLADKAEIDVDGCEPDKQDGEDAEEENKDSSDDKSQSLNADAADDIFRQRLAICRIGDKLHMDGLENMSIKQGKKAIIAKVLPNMRMDGKSDAYIDAMFDLAVGEANKHKDVAYQKQQMTAQAPKKRADSNESMAASARKRMMEREGGNQ